MNIDYDKEKARFVIRCQVWANDALSNLQSKRWNKTLRAWTAPKVRMVVEEVAKLVKLPGAECTPAVAAVLKEYKDKANKVEEVGFPAWYTFKTKPGAHQLAGLNRLYGKDEWAVHGEMGTGKTKMTIDGLCAMRMEGRISAALVIVKHSVRRSWEEEFTKHAPIPASVKLLDAGKGKAFEKWMWEPHDFKVAVMGTESMSFGQAHEIATRFMACHSRVAIVLDESHFIANHKSIRTERIIDLARMGEVRITLTGTAIANAIMDLFSQFEFLNPDIVGCGDFYSFRNRYAIMGGFRDPKTRQPQEVVGYQNMPELMDLIRPYVYQVSKEEAGLNLPPKVYKRRYVDMTAEQVAYYKEINKTKAFTVRGETFALSNVLEEALRKHQISGGFTVFKREEVKWTQKKGEHIIKVGDTIPVIPPAKNPKINELIETIKEAGESRQYIVWAVYRPEIEAIAAALEAAGLGPIGQYHGGVHDDDRTTLRNEYQAGRVRGIVANQTTGGTGITLTAASLVCYYSNSFSMVHRRQSEDRAHRIGQTKSVTYVDLICENSVDEIVLQAIDAKMDLADYVRQQIAAGKNPLVK
jgi:SNF2 family DNA or RNA helicase